MYIQNAYYRCVIAESIFCISYGVQMWKTFLCDIIFICFTAYYMYNTLSIYCSSILMLAWTWYSTISRVAGDLRCWAIHVISLSCAFNGYEYILCAFNGSEYILCSSAWFIRWEMNSTIYIYKCELPLSVKGGWQVWMYLSSWMRCFHVYVYIVETNCSMNALQEAF